MNQNFRHFRAGPDPAGRIWQVDFLWLQTAVAIRHSDSVDVKFLLTNDGEELEKIISLHHPELLELSRKSGRPLTDPWCMKLAAAHLEQVVTTGTDFEKDLITVSPEELSKYNTMIG